MNGANMVAFFISKFGAGGRLGKYVSAATRQDRRAADADTVARAATARIMRHGSHDRVPVADAAAKPAASGNRSDELSLAERVIADVAEQRNVTLHSDEEIATAALAAAALVVMSAAEAKRRSIKPLARIVSWATAGVDPALMGTGPIPASRKALQRAGWTIGDLDLIEANEAFAAQACAVNKDLGWDAAKVNVNGGAVALGHPIGASGARVLTTLLFEMRRRDAKKGLATLCVGGGMGVAMCVER